LPPDARF